MSPLLLDLSGIGVALDGLSLELAARLRDEWGFFVATEIDRPFLHLDVGYHDAPYDEPEFRPKKMRATFSDGIARYSMPEGHAEVGLDGRGRVSLIDGLGDRTYHTLLNLLRAGLAWTLPNRTGALLHAAGLLVDGRAFLLIGPEGSGKSSWARLGEQAGESVISDDLVLVDGNSARFEVLGAPFRSTHRTDYLRGAWPLAAILFPARGLPPTARAVSDLVAQARLTANLPFVAEGIENESRIEKLVRRLAGSVDCADFSFGLDPSFVDLLRAWPPSRG